MKTRTIVLMTGPSLTAGTAGIQTHVKNFIAAFSSSTRIELRYLAITEGLYDREGWIAKIRRVIGTLIPFVKAARNADVVHLNSTFDNRSMLRDGLYLLLANLMLAKPVVFQFHGGLPRRVGLLQRMVTRRLLEFVLSRAAQILILSRAQGEQFSQLFPVLKYSVVPNYIDSEEVPIRRAFSGSPTRFLFLGRLHEDKGLKEIVLAAKALCQKGLIFVVEVCGDGPLRQWLVDEIGEPNFRRGVISYTGVVTGAGKQAALSRADVMLLPSYGEGFPYALLEASAAGIPTIATPVGAIPDVINTGFNGLLVPVRDATALATQMAYVISHPDQVQALGLRAREQVEAEFSVRNLRIAFERIYGEAVTV